MLCRLFLYIQLLGMLFLCCREIPHLPDHVLPIFGRRIPLRILFGEQIIIIALGGLDFLYCHVYFYAILCYNR